MVGTLSAVDPDDANGTGNYLFAFVDGNGTANDKFTLDANGTLRTAVIFDYESFEGNASLLIRAGTRDDHNATFVRNGYVFVHNQVEDLDGDGIEDHADPDDDNDGFSDAEELAYGSDPWNPASVANQFPTAIDLNVATVAENQPVGTILGDFNASDPDANATHVFTLVDGNGSQHNNFFTIDANGTLRTAAILDYETNATRSIRVRASDEHNASLEKTFVVSMTDVNEPPVIIGNRLDTISNPMPGDKLTITDANGASLEISFFSDSGSVTGILDETAVVSLYQHILGRSPDPAGLSYWSTSGQSYSLLLNAFYGSLEVQSLTTSTSGHAYVPIGASAIETREYLHAATSFLSFADPVRMSVSKSFPEDQVFSFDVNATDPDGDVLTYSISGGVDQARFFIHPSTGVLSFASAPDYENPIDVGTNNSYEVEVTVTDDTAETLTDVHTMTVTVTDVFENAIPTHIFLSNPSVAENQPIGTVVGEFNATDPDANSNHAFTFVNGNGSQHNHLFQIDANGTLRTAQELDFEANATLSVRVRATDEHNANFEKTFAISVTNQVEDIDGDGIEDHADPDDDNDGFSDAEEVIAGTDPTNAQSVPNLPPTALELAKHEIHGKPAGGFEGRGVRGF